MKKDWLHPEAQRHARQRGSSSLEGVLMPILIAAGFCLWYSEFDHNEVRYLASTPGTATEVRKIKSFHSRLCIRWSPKKRWIRKANLDHLFLLVGKKPLGRILRETPFDHLFHFQSLHAQQVQDHIISQPKLRWKFSRGTQHHSVQCGLLIIVKHHLCKRYEFLTSGRLSFATMITVPVGSSPRLPARPAIWVYSPGRISRKFLPSCFLMLENTTHLAGMLTPYDKWEPEQIRTCKPTMANVSVANSILTNPLAKRISTS